MSLPLSLWDIALWTAITAIILLVSSELLSPFYGRTGVIVDRRRLRLVALAVAFIFFLLIFFLLPWRIESTK